MVTATTTTTTRPFAKPIVSRESVFFDSFSDDLTDHENYHLLPVNRCGPIPMVRNRITNGKKAALEEFPWMALIAYHTPGITNIICFITGVVFKYSKKINNILCCRCWYRIPLWRHCD